MPEVSLFEHAMERYGMPGLVILLGAFALWRAAKWFGAKIAEPLVTSHVGLVTSVQAQDVKIADNQEMQTSLLQQMANAVTEVKSHQTISANHSETILARQTDMLEVMGQIASKCPTPNCPIVTALSTMKAHQKQSSAQPASKPSQQGQQGE